jgi:hypothetical protein
LLEYLGGNLGGYLVEGKPKGPRPSLVPINVQTPETLTPRERNLIEDLSREFEADKPT